MAPISVNAVKILHTSDWHLGRTLHGVDMHQHQAAFLDHLVDVVETRSVDAVLVAGDIYDRAIPSVETVKMLSAALSRLSRHATVVITPGNHDSATRLGFGSQLMRDDIRILASIDDIHTPVMLGDDDIAVYGLPYLDPDLARMSLASADGTLPARSHEAVLTAAIARIRDDIADRKRRGSNPRTILMAHAFIVGGKASESERDITIGGVASAPSTIFDGFDYVALGHLHGPQTITLPGSDTMMRYSGSPLAYSFSERDHKKSTALLDFGAGGVPSVGLIPAPVPRPLQKLQGDIEWLLGPDNEQHVDSWVWLEVTDPSYPTDMQSRLRQRFTHPLSIQHIPPANNASSAPAVTEAMSPVEVGTQFIEFATTAEATEAEATLLRAAYDVANAAQRSA